MDTRGELRDLLAGRLLLLIILVGVEGLGTTGTLLQTTHRLPGVGLLVTTPSAHGGLTDSASISRAASDFKNQKKKPKKDY